MRFMTVFEGNVIVRLFSGPLSVFRSHSFPYRSLLLGTNVPNDTTLYQIHLNQYSFTLSVPFLLSDYLLVQLGTL